MSEFHFLRPWWFSALIPLLILLWVLWRRRLHSRSWQEICDPQLLPHLLIGKSTRRANWPLAFLVLGTLLAVTALAGPTWQKQQAPVLRQQSALIIAMDVSRSMLAEDLKPSRLVRARLKIEDILRQRREGQTALIAFTYDAFAVTPLTDDTRTIRALLGSLAPDMMPVQGSRPERVFFLAHQLMKQAGLTSATVLLITDEDRPEESMAAATEMHNKGLTLNIIGVATPAGAPIPQTGGGFLKDRQGNMVLPRLNEAGLRQLAAAGGGAYRRLAIDDSDFKALLSDLDSRRLDQAQQDKKRTGDLWQDAGVWLVWPLAVLVLCGFRRGWLLIFPLLLLLPPSAQALEFQDLWKNSQQQAYEKFKQGDYNEAARQFRDPRWKAASNYQAGDYEAALRSAAEPETADDWYNLGNIQTKSGLLEEAKKSFEKALEIDSRLDDARENKETVEKLIKQKKQQQEQQQNQQDNQNQQGQNSDQQQQKEQNNQQSQADNSDQQQNSAQGQDQEADQQQQNQSQEQQPSGQQQADKQAEQTQAAQQAEQVQQEDDKQADQEQNLSANTDQQQEEGEQQKAQVAQTEEGDEDQPEDPELQQWLRRIPDDPGGLLKHKFQYQYRYMYPQGDQEGDRSW